MRDPKEDPHRRFEAAKAAAPYVHPRLTAVGLEHGGKFGVTVRIEGDDRALL
jgi:hypothetical protein